MKKITIFTTLFSLLFFISCSQTQEGTVSLKGKIENAGELEYVLLAAPSGTIDTIELEANKSFKWESSAIEPTLYTLQVSQRPYMLVMKNGEKVEISFDLNNPDNYTVVGSETSSKMKELETLRQPFQEQREKLQQEFQRRMDRGEEMSLVQAELIAENQNIISQLSQPVVEFSLDNKDNLAGFYGMVTVYSVDPTGQEETVIAYVEDVQDKFPNNRDVQSFASHIENIKHLSIGQIAPDFSSVTPQGDEVKLSDFRGQYVLLDFWAAWCAPCRDENPNIVAQYHAYKDQGFTVLGVSLDRDRQAWLDAIENDQLEWTQVSDLKMWESDAAGLYNISAIPASFMLNPQGKIIGKNLRGPALQRFLEENL